MNNTEEVTQEKKTEPYEFCQECGARMHYHRYRQNKEGKTVYVYVCKKDRDHTYNRVGE